MSEITLQECGIHAITYCHGCDNDPCNEGDHNG
jgi:hypothetical protein